MFGEITTRIKSFLTDFTFMQPKTTVSKLVASQSTVGTVITQTYIYIALAMLELT